MIAGGPLTDRFWREFVETCWNRKPAVIRSPFRKPLVTPGEVFRGVVRASRRRLRVPTEDFTLLLDKRRIVMAEDLRRVLPRAQDRSLGRYLARLNRTAGKEVGIYVNNFQADLGWPFLERLQQFLGGLYEFVGVPANLAEVDLFLGNYRRTPTGVHRDSADVFCLVVEGRKRMRAWPAAAIRSCSRRAGPANYGDYVPGSICLDGEPGDILFWPSSYWHIAESDGSPSSSLSVGLYYGDPLVHALDHCLAGWAHGAWRSGVSGDSLPFSNPRLPARLSAAARRAGRDARRLPPLLMRHWMERTTAYGFSVLPPVHRRASPFGRRKVRLNSTSRILSARIGRDVLVAANGRSAAIPYHANLDAVLRDLISGQPCAANRRDAEPSSARSIRLLLQFLLDARAAT